MSSVSSYKVHRYSKGVTGMIHNNSKITLQAGCAAHSWRRRGEDEKGTGRRSNAIKWRLGVSGKQNEDLCLRDGFSNETVGSIKIS